MRRYGDGLTDDAFMGRQIVGTEKTGSLDIQRMIILKNDFIVLQDMDKNTVVPTLHLRRQFPKIVQGQFVPG